MSFTEKLHLPKGLHHFFSQIFGRFQREKAYFSQALFHPMDALKAIPQWSLVDLLWLQIPIAAMSGLLKGLVDKSVLAAVAGALFEPLVSLAFVGIVSLAFFYFGQIAFKSHRGLIDYLRFFTVVSWPLHILNVITPFFWGLAMPLGVLVCGLATWITLVREFHFGRRTTLKFVSVLIIVFWIYWFVEKVNWNLPKQRGPSATGSSLKTLEKEFE